MTYIAEALRLAVAQRANGRCEYCRLHQDHTYFTHEIDHIYAEKHNGETSETNLCLACADCNRHKGSDQCSLNPMTGDVTVLFHPRRNQWSQHFRMNHNGIIEPLTSIGRVTERVLNFNRIDLVADRARLIARNGYNEP